MSIATRICQGIAVRWTAGSSRQLKHPADRRVALSALGERPLLSGLRHVCRRVPAFILLLASTPGASSVLPVLCLPIILPETLNGIPAVCKETCERFEGAMANLAQQPSRAFSREPEGRVKTPRKDKGSKRLVRETALVEPLRKVTDRWMQRKDEADPVGSPASETRPLSVA